MVIDEVAGQAISVFPVYALARTASPSLFWSLVAGVAFLLFRIVDVVKPGPVGKAESLPGGPWRHGGRHSRWPSRGGRPRGRSPGFSLKDGARRKARPRP